MVREKWFGDGGRRLWLKEQLHLTRSKIHVSMDIWTSEEGINYLSVVAHFLDGNSNLQTALLDLPPLKGPHSCENIANVLSTALEFYELGHPVYWVVQLGEGGNRPNSSSNQAKPTKQVK